MALWINDGLHEAAQGIRSFLLVGQSNMAGRGDLTPENTITAPDCFMLRMGRWQPMSEPINVDRAVAEGAVPRSGANLAASFAAQLQKETGAKIGLIPCADGGTRISQWQPGEVLFDHIVEAVDVFGAVFIAPFHAQNVVLRLAHARLPEKKINGASIALLSGLRRVWGCCNDMGRCNKAA